MKTRASVSAGGQAVTAHGATPMTRLTLLAPEMVEAILDGRQPAELQLDAPGFPMEWEA